MNETPKTKRGWRILRRLLIGAVILATLVAIFYTEEDWRGKRAWENCKRELEAKGAVLDWNAYIPPPVPDDQNFFAAPKMQGWFVKIQSSLSNELTVRLLNTDTVATNLNEAASAKYLTWSDQFEPDFDLIREALKRPYARMDGDYSKPYARPIPNFVAVRIVAQTLAQRAKCYLLLGQPDKALQELTLMHDMCHLLVGAPTGKSMTLVAAMINVAVTGLYVNTLADGLQSHAWQEQQLAALQEQLAQINLTPFVLAALQEEPAAVCRDFEIESMPISEFINIGQTSKSKWPGKIGDWLWPHGWTYQNMVNVILLEKKSWDGFDLAHDTVFPRKLEKASSEVDRFFGSDQPYFFGQNSPYKFLAAFAIPNFTKAEQTAAHTQTLVNEAQIVCALERYHLAHGEYPETLDALAPQFIQTIPHDIIGGEPLHYRRTDDGKFLLYSVGWNETDDGGKDGGNDFTKYDWVWKN
jgi:hypothetical protein